jgi:cytochrome c553
MTRISAIKLCLLLLLLPAAIAAQQSARVQSGNSDRSEEMRLDVKGSRGAVRFNHKTHEKVAPDPNSPHRARPNATCVGCHHTRNSVGAPQLWRCGTCHLDEGHVKNPRDRNFDEVYAERAFHSKCVSCHQASNRGPLTCGECHKRGE